MTEWIGQCLGGSPGHWSDVSSPCRCLPRTRRSVMTRHRARQIQWKGPPTSRWYTGRPFPNWPVSNRR